MKTKLKRIDLRASESDEKNLQKAAEKMGTKKLSKVIFDSVKDYANQPPEMFFCDRLAIRQVDENISWGRIHLQSFTDQIKLITGATLNRDELEQIFKFVGKLGSTSNIQREIKELITKKLYAQMQAEYPKMIITESNLPNVDLIDLFETADKLDDVPAIGQRSIINFHCYTVEEGIFSVIKDEVEKIKNAYRFYASTPGELKKLALIKTLCESLNSLMADKEVIPEKIFSLVYFDPEARQFAPSGSYIKYNLQGKIIFTH